MKKLTIFSLLIALPSIALARVEILDRVAVIVDDGLIMESQITQSILEIKMNQLYLLLDLARSSPNSSVTY